MKIGNSPESDLRQDGARSLRYERTLMRGRAAPSGLI
jgi:hypothetical protein